MASHYETQMSYHLIRAAMLLAMRNSCDEIYIRDSVIRAAMRAKGSDVGCIAYKQTAHTDAAAAAAETATSDVATAAAAADRGVGGLSDVSAAADATVETEDTWTRYGDLVVNFRSGKHVPLMQRTREGTPIWRIAFLFVLLCLFEVGAIFLHSTGCLI